MNSVSLIEDIQVIWITVNFQGIGTFEIYEYEVVCSILNNFLMSLVYTMIIPLLFLILIIWVFLLVSMARGLYIFIVFFFKESTFGFVDNYLSFFFFQFQWLLVSFLFPFFDLLWVYIYIFSSFSKWILRSIIWDFLLEKQ